VQVTPERMNGWWISPALPTIANCLLAVLWGFSTAGGWGETAFCGTEADHGGACASGFRVAVLISIAPAALAAITAAVSWALPQVRHRPARLDALLTAAAALWILAEGVLFIGGYLAKP
jgi:hypothetical protein